MQNSQSPSRLLVKESRWRMILTDHKRWEDFFKLMIVPMIICNILKFFHLKKCRKLKKQLRKIY